jgi:hypothetical protein
VAGLQMATLQFGRESVRFCLEELVVIACVLVLTKGFVPSSFICVVQGSSSELTVLLLRVLLALS